MDWDEEAQQAAVRQAQSMSSRDPEAASLLIAHVVAAQEIQEKNGTTVSRMPNDYNPLKLYDYACREYGWTVRDCDETHYLTFFAMIREANERHRLENEALKGK